MQPEGCCKPRGGWPTSGATIDGDEERHQEGADCEWHQKDAGGWAGYEGADDEGYYGDADEYIGRRKSSKCTWEYEPKYKYLKFEEVQKELHVEFMNGKIMQRAMKSRGHEHAHSEACRLVSRHLMTNDVVQCGNSARIARGEVQILAPYRCPNPLHVYVCRYHDIYSILMHVIFVYRSVYRHMQMSLFGSSH